MLLFYADAQWDLSAGKIVICYELAQDFAMLFRDFGITMEPEPK